MKPVYNGDMGIYRWKLRFARERGPVARRRFPAGPRRPTGRRRRTTIRDFWATAIGPRCEGVAAGNRLEGSSAGGSLAARDRRRLVGVCHRRQLRGHAGAARRRGIGLLLPRRQRRAGVDARRRGPLRSGRLPGRPGRHRPAGHADDSRRQDSHARRAPASSIASTRGPATCIWSHDTADETGADVIVWGKSGSPLVVDDMVIVSVGAPNDEAARENYHSSLVAYDLATGDVRWAAGNRQASYASPLVADARRRAADRDGQRKVRHRPPRRRRQRAVGISLGRRRRLERHDDAADSARRRPAVSVEGLWRRLVAAAKCRKMRTANSPSSRSGIRRSSG